MPASPKHPLLRFTCLLLAALLFAGCATGRDPRDPLESFNRRVYQFNEAVDRAVLKPVAEGYRKVLPQFVRASVSNFFSNINDVVVAFNNLLQGKFTAAYTDFGRVAINSTLGVLGLFDIASEAGIEKHNEDFGQTLGWWGVGDGPFIMLPFLGPSSGRDAVGRVVDYATDPVTYVDPSGTRLALRGTRIVNQRAELLGAVTVLETAALDPYEFIRDAYLQRRRNLVYDGVPPPDREFLDPPPKPQGSGSAPRSSVYPAGADPSGPGSVLVSGSALTPVESTYSRPAPAIAIPTATRLPPPTPRQVEPLTALPLEMLPPGPSKIGPGATVPAHELPRLSRFDRTNP